MNNLNDNSSVFSHEREKISSLITFAKNIGATHAASLDPSLIRIENRLAAYCRKPKCPHFGMSMSCPPHVAGPASLRARIKDCRHAIVIRIEVDGDSLHGEDRPAVMRLLHEITAAVELEAKRLGFSHAQAFAGGSCKMSFCADNEQCAVISGEGPCRFADSARPSMSGYGVNVGELMKAAGWSTSLFGSSADTPHGDLAWVAGLVLLA